MAMFLLEAKCLMHLVDAVVIMDDENRQNEQLSKYGDTKSARNIMLLELKKLIEANPLFRDKLNFPPFKASRLRTLINQRCLVDLILIYLVTHIALLSYTMVAICE